MVERTRDGVELCMDQADAARYKLVIFRINLGRGLLSNRH